MDPKYICLVTIHGVGFMQPPINGIPGYADGLHQHLSKYLDEHLLGDDPKRQMRTLTVVFELGIFYR